MLREEEETGGGEGKEYKEQREGGGERNYITHK